MRARDARGIGLRRRSTVENPMTPRTLRRLPPALALAAFVAGAAPALAVTTLQPDEAGSKDVLLYEFDVPGIFGIPTPPRTTNLDSETLNAIDPPPVPFGNFLGSAMTDPFRLTPDGPLREHGTRSLLEFDLSGVALDADRVRKATIGLYALPALRAFESPSAMNPVTVDLRQVTEAWGEQTATWENDPDVMAMIVATEVQSGVNRWLTFDVTDLVKFWLTDPSMNFGVEISQRAVVEIPQPDGARDRYVASLFASSAFADPALRPTLTVAPVPVPAALPLMAMAVTALAALRLRRRAA
jgi:hypothetical protein